MAGLGPILQRNSMTYNLPTCIDFASPSNFGKDVEKKELCSAGGRVPAILYPILLLSLCLGLFISVIFFTLDKVFHFQKKKYVVSCFCFFLLIIPSLRSFFFFF